MAKYDSQIAREIQEMLDKIKPLESGYSIAQAIEYNAQVLAAVESAFDGVMIPRADFERLQSRLDAPAPKQEGVKPRVKIGDFVVFTEDVVTREASNVFFKKGERAKVVSTFGVCGYIVVGLNNWYSAVVNQQQIKPAIGAFAENK